VGVCVCACVRLCVYVCVALCVALCVVAVRASLQDPRTQEAIHYMFDDTLRLTLLWRLVMWGLFFLILVAVGVTHTGRDATYTFGFSQAMSASLVYEEINSDYPDTFADIANVNDFYDWLKNPVTDAIYDDTLGCVCLRLLRCRVALTRLVACTAFGREASLTKDTRTTRRHSSSRLTTSWDAHACASYDPSPWRAISHVRSHTRCSCVLCAWCVLAVVTQWWRAAYEMVQGSVFGETACFGPFELSTVDEAPMVIDDITCVCPHVAEASHPVSNAVPCSRVQHPIPQLRRAVVQWVCE